MTRLLFLKEAAQRGVEGDQSRRRIGVQLRRCVCLRTGYFYEHFSKGNRQFITLGAGVKYTVFTVDLS